MYVFLRTVLKIAVHRSFMGKIRQNQQSVDQKMSWCRLITNGTRPDGLETTFRSLVLHIDVISFSTSTSVQFIFRWWKRSLQFGSLMALPQKWLSYPHIILNKHTKPFFPADISFCRVCSKRSKPIKAFAGCGFIRVSHKLSAVSNKCTC